jgi:hypothetical protein
MKFLHAVAEVCISCTKNGTVTYIWSLAPQLETLRSKSRHLRSLHVHYNLHIALIQGFCGTACEIQLSILLPVIQF